MANYTEHYQLHQWEPEDNFLRTDFNEDLQKIDTALGKATENQLIWKKTLSEVQTQLHIPLTDLAWSGYRRLLLRPYIRTDSNYNAELYFNGSKTAESVICNQGKSASILDYYAAIFTYPTHYYEPSAFNEIVFYLDKEVVTCSYRYAFCYKHSADSSWILDAATGFSIARKLTWSEVTKITITAPANMLDGSSFQLYGIQ